MYLSIPFARLRHGEFSQFIKSIIRIVTSNDHEVLKVKKQVDKISVLYAAMDDFYKPEVGSAITQDLQNLDSERDNGLIGIEQIIRGYSHHYEEATRADADLLMKSSNSFGDDIPRLNYQLESNAIGKIVKKWKSDDVLSNAVNLLHLNEWIDRLETINEQFETRFLERLKNDANEPEFKMIDYRKQITDCYHNLIKHIEAHATLSGDAVYTEVENEINQLIEVYNRLIDGRTKKKEEALKEE